MTALETTEAPSTTQKWQYATLVQTGGFLGRKSEELHRKNLETQLASWGAQGWELSWVLMDQNLHGEKDGHVFIFKCPMP